MRIVGNVVCGAVLVVGCSTSVSPDHLNKRYTVLPYYMCTSKWFGYCLTQWQHIHVAKVALTDFLGKHTAVILHNLSKI